MKNRNGQDNGGLSSVRSDGENRERERGWGVRIYPGRVIQSFLDAAMERTWWWLLLIIICIVGSGLYFS